MLCIKLILNIFEPLNKLFVEWLIQTNCVASLQTFKPKSLSSELCFIYASILIKIKWRFNRVTQNFWEKGYCRNWLRLTGWQIDRLTDWQIDRLTDWQMDRIDSLTHWQINTLTYWQIENWQVDRIDRLTDWQIDRLIDWQIDRLTELTVWQIDRLTDWQNDRLTDWQVDR